MKNILITGTSKGIGFETVKLLLEDSNNRVIAISRNIETLQALEEKERLIAVSLDVTSNDYSQLKHSLEGVNHIDVLINNAGLLISKPFDKLTMEDWQRMFAVNVLAPVQLIRYLLPRLQQAPKAHVVNIGSMGGFQGSSKFPGLSAYSASKAALANLSECLAGELNGIACNCLCLGAVNTEMLQQAFPSYKAPLNSEEMAQLIVDFSLKGHQFMNGQVLPVALNNPG